MLATVGYTDLNLFINSFQINIRGKGTEEVPCVILRKSLERQDFEGFLADESENSESKVSEQEKNNIA